MMNSPMTSLCFYWEPETVAYEWNRKNAWIEAFPPTRLLRPTDPTPVASPEPPTPSAKAAAYAAFRTQVPDELVAAVERFPSHQWALLKLLREEQAFRDLHAHNPVLAFLLANHMAVRGVDHQLAFPRAKLYVKKKQREILGWLGFPAEEGVVRLLRKIPPECAETHVLRIFRNALTGEPSLISMLSHLPRLPSGVLALVSNLRLAAHLTPKLIQEVADDPDEHTEAPTADLLLDSLAMAQELDGETARLTRFEAKAQIVRRHDELVRLYMGALEKLVRRRKDPSHWPEPPLPGTEFIIPITSRSMLRTEGAIQSNCVASYEKRIRSGAVYIYRVLHPERCTLAIVPGYHGGWRRLRMEARASARPQHATCRVVDAWLGSHSLSV